MAVTRDQLVAVAEVALAQEVALNALRSQLEPHVIVSCRSTCFAMVNPLQ